MLKQTFFTSFDKQEIGITTASKLILIPIWNGNRVLDEGHVKEIEKSIRTPEELNGTIIRIAIVKGEEQENRFIVDGQHRATVIKNYFENNPLAEDFNILIAEKEFASEGEIVGFFKNMNRTRNIEWKEDPKMIANKYIEVLLQEFQPISKNKKQQKQYFKTEKTKKPYVHIDKMRDLMIERHIVNWDFTPEEYVKKAVDYNTTLLHKLSCKSNKSSIEEKALDLGFALALDDNYLWI